MPLNTDASRRGHSSRFGFSLPYALFLQTYAILYILYTYTLKKLSQLFCCRQDCQVRQDPRQGGCQGGPQVRRSQGEQRIR